MIARSDLAQALTKSVRGDALSRPETRRAFESALSADADALQLAGLLASMATRGESVEEVSGAVDALRASMLVFEHDHPDAIDTCGTGGDDLGLVNLSTGAALVAAAAGARVIKHGNRAISSRAGSADLLEAAGVAIRLEPGASRALLDELGITFLFAPRYHPALARAAAVRRALGVRTIFNFLGPLLNPGRVRRQLLGVGERQRVSQFAAVLAALGAERALVVHGAGGADELTLAGANLVAAHGFDAPPTLDAVACGLAPAPVGALVGGDAAANLRALERAFDGEAGPIADALALNAAGALLVAALEPSVERALARAREALASGAARRLLARWAERSRELEARP